MISTAVGANAQDCDRRQMGNILESDSSTDSADIGEVRTAGDGMEMERGAELAADHQRQPGLITADPATATANVTNPNISHRPLLTNTLQNAPCPQLISSEKRRTSPRSLPPSKDLIPLKPIRIIAGFDSAKVPESIGSHMSDSNFTAQSSMAPRKQREPKFVPYEPYAAAVRPIGSSSEDVRRDSSASSSIIAVSDDTSIPSVIQSPTRTQSRRPIESSNTTLLKERLRLADKDIEELQIENTRLKRLLVDTLVGTPNNSKPKDHESIESLSNEIQVWRSKFLSSCVLVEQLTKEKEDLVKVTISASELLKDIKSHVDLTPDLYNSLRDWISAEERERTIRKESYFGSSGLDEDEI